MLSRITDAARELGCSPDHVRRMIRGGHWPFYKLGPKALRVDPEEIKDLGRMIAKGERDREKS